MLSAIFAGNRGPLFSGAGESTAGDLVIGLASDGGVGAAIFCFLGGGAADLGGLPGPRFSPVLGGCICAISVRLSMVFVVHRCSGLSVGEGHAIPASQSRGNHETTLLEHHMHSTDINQNAHARKNFDTRKKVYVASASQELQIVVGELRRTTSHGHFGSETSNMIQIAYFEGFVPST